MALSHLKSSSSGSNFLKPLATAFSLRRPISTSTDPITVETSVPFTTHRCDPPSRTVETSPQELLSFFRDMATMRRMEDRRRLSIQGQAHPRILPPLRRPRSRGRWYGGCNYQKGQHHNCLP
ncbi:hypothetical protein OIU77_014786 [Salix suchowensis]|uniref:Uncharacterized protein n=1 Tax=Salix suchowensis TaxID=1278906 RepID=A0ABQ8ZYP3_9ROSI|nr:hypothetical protein OIU77_014786 [Salix suchowensis]